MKKINFNLFYRLGNNRQPLFPRFDFKPLSSPTFFTAIFNRFSLPHQPILAKKIDQKHYQIKLKSEFINSGSPLARLLSPLIKKSARPVPDFPQIPVKSSSLTLSNYINLTAFTVIYRLLKKQAKTINQSRSNYSVITAKSLTSFNFESAGDNRQGQGDQKNSINNTGQIQRARIDHLSPFSKLNEKYNDSIPYDENINPFNNSDGPITAAANHATDIFARNSDNRFTWAVDRENSINPVYHRLCN